MNSDLNPLLQNQAALAPNLAPALLPLLLPALLGQVFQEASPEDRSRLLAPLLQPLGLLALVAVARGIFARRLLSRNGRAATLRPQDTTDIQPQDVASLAQRVQQVNAQALYALVPVLLSLAQPAATEAAQRLLALQAEEASRCSIGAAPDLDSLLA